MKVSLPKLKLRFSDSPKIRGFFASLNPEQTALHNHLEDRFIYKYPKIQYKVIKSVPYLIAVDEAIQVLYPILMETEVVTIATQSHRVEDVEIKLENVEFGPSNQYYEYQFVTPWLCLNQENYLEYQSSDDKEKLLESVMIGNILSFSKGFNINVENKLQCKLNVTEKKTRLKGTVLLGFIGTFKVNYLLPEYLGLGKSVARGFGTIKLKGMVKDEVL